MTDKKLKRIFLFVVVICILIIIVEGIMFLYIRDKNDKKNIYYDSYTMSINDKNNIVSVGSSYFRYSKLNKYTGGYEKGKLIKRDKDGKIVFEFQYDKGNNSTFTSVIEYDGAYYVTGSGEYSDEQTENNLRDAFLIKFDKNGKKVWEKYYGVLANTRFNKAVLVDDGIIVIGSSLYENMEVGNHTTGGGIIVKYDFDGKEVWHNNHGGNKSGVFNDIVVIEDDIYVAGKDGADSSNIVKFNKDGKYVWHKNYSYTDNKGNQAIVYYNDLLYILGSKKILDDEDDEERKTDNTDGLIISYDKDGNKKDEYTFGGSGFERFTSAVVMDDYLYVLGLSTSTDIKDMKIELNKADTETIYSSFVLKYDKDLNVVDKLLLGGKNNDMLNNISLSKNKLLLSGLSNSKDSNIKSKKNNGKDYFGKIISINEKLDFEVIE